MELRQINTEEIELAAAWMSQKENYQWLEFGHGSRILSPMTIRIMTQRDIHVMRFFTPDCSDAPIGLVSLSDINWNVGTATLWYVLGNKAYAGQGYTSHAVSKLLAHGFRDLRLHAVNAWTVEHNTPSIRVLERNSFRLVGRQRQCHCIDAQRFDRLLFDLLATEHEDNPVGSLQSRQSHSGSRRADVTR